MGHFFYPLKLMRRPGLDIFRSVAILLVLFGHSGLLLSEVHHLNFLDRMVNQWDGVSLFFVLSGFLITGQLFELFENHSPLKAWGLFLVNRIFRILPLYYVMVVLLFAFSKNTTFGDVIPYFLFLQNLFSPMPYFFPESWSLTIEEWFYLLLPLLFFIFHRGDKIGLMVGVGLSLVAFPLILRVLHPEVDAVFEIDETVRKIVIYRLDAIGYGVLMAFLFRQFPAVFLKNKNLMALTGIAFSLILYVVGEQLKFSAMPFYYVFDGLTWSLFLPYLFDVNLAEFPKIKLLFKWVSVHAYSLYLVNLSLVQTLVLPQFKFVLHENEGMFWVAFWVSTFVLAVILRQIIELPFLKMRDVVLKKLS